MTRFLPFAVVGGLRFYLSTAANLWRCSRFAPRWRCLFSSSFYTILLFSELSWHKLELFYSQLSVNHPARDCVSFNMVFHTRIIDNIAIRKRSELQDCPAAILGSFRPLAKGGPDNQPSSIHFISSLVVPCCSMRWKKSLWWIDQQRPIKKSGSLIFVSPLLMSMVAPPYSWCLYTYFTYW